MDLKTILPFMMNGKNANLESLLAFASGSEQDQQKAMGDLLGKTDPRLASVFSLAKPNTPKSYGLTPILDLADDEIAGKLAKFFATA